MLIQLLIGTVVLESNKANAWKMHERWHQFNDIYYQKCLFSFSASNTQMITENSFVLPYPILSYGIENAVFWLKLFDERPIIWSQLWQKTQ